MGTPRSPILAPNRHELSIYHLTYRQSRGRRRRFHHWLRVPYAGLFALNEVLARALSRGRILDFRLSVTSAITPDVRDSLRRWNDALAHDGSGIAWTE